MRSMSVTTAEGMTYAAADELTFLTPTANQDTPLYFKEAQVVSQQRRQLFATIMCNYTSYIVACHARTYM